MIRALRAMVWAGVVLVGGGTVAETARGQVGPYPYGGGGRYAPLSPGWGAGYGGGGYGNGYGAGYGPAWRYGNGDGNGYGNAIAPGGCYRPQPSPAARQGYWEGQRYWETGIAPNHRLSPAETQGFLAGERRTASTPWQLDPVRQQGYREGLRYWETGIAPRHPLSPAEAQGFEAAERRAATGRAWPY